MGLPGNQMMNRRYFLALFSAGVAGIALEQAIPLGRVWSFPKEIVIAQGLPAEYRIVRFVKAWQPHSSVMIAHLESLYGKEWSRFDTQKQSFFYCGLPPG